MRPRRQSGWEELAEDYRRMIYAESRPAVEQARTRFAKEWRLRCPAVVECLDEAEHHRRIVSDVTRVTT